MSVTNATQLAEFFHITANEEFTLWCNQWWREMDTLEFHPDHPLAIIHGVHHNLLAMHPDLLPLARFTSGNSFCVRVGKDGTLVECGIWSLADKSWLPIDTTISQALVAYFINEVTKENLRDSVAQTTANAEALQQEIKQAALSFASCFLEEADSFLRQHTADAEAVLSHLMRSRVRNATSLFARFIEEHDFALLADSQEYTLPALENGFYKSLANWIALATSDKATPDLLFDRFIRASENREFSKLVYATALHASVNPSPLRALLRCIASIATQYERQFDSADATYIAETLDLITPLWKHLRSTHPQLPKLNRLKKMGDIEPLQLLYDSNIARDFIAKQLRPLVDKPGLELPAASASWLKQVQRETDADPSVGDDSDEWMRQGEQALADGNHALGYEHFYNAGWICRSHQNQADAMEQLLQCAEQGRFPAWLALAQWHQR